jgi:Toprim domain
MDNITTGEVSSTLARRLGGEASGDQITCPGPGHSSRDRSLSVKFNSDGSYIVHSYAGDDWLTCRDYVRDIIGGKVQPLRIMQPHETERNLHRARHLWSCREPAAGTIVETYLQARGLTSAPASIGYLQAGAYPHPAMIAAFGIADEPEPGVVDVLDVRGIHLTFLNGNGKADIDRPKIMLGPSCSFPIVIAPPNDLLGLAITEGIEDAISVHEATGLGAWAAGSASRMAALATRVPNYIECVTVFAHSDEAGQRSAYTLADALSKINIEALVEGVK